MTIFFRFPSQYLEGDLNSFYSCHNQSLFKIYQETFYFCYYHNLIKNFYFHNYFGRPKQFNHFKNLSQLYYVFFLFKCLLNLAMYFFIINYHNFDYKIFMKILDFHLFKFFILQTIHFMVAQSFYLKSILILNHSFNIRYLYFII